jgi:hypothetical protein
MSRACSSIWGEGFWWKTRRKRPLGSPRCWWVDNIKMDLRVIGCGGMDWIDMVRIRTSGGILGTQ